ncbi:amidohydrolase, partial [Lysobacter sp. 2RAB21]
MKRPLSVALRCALSFSVLAALPLAAAAQSGERPEVASAAAKVKADVVTWRRDFHEHPELSNREERTSAKVVEHLRKLGLKPRTGIARHGVVAIIEGGKPGPKIALRADMDALP